MRGGSICVPTYAHNLKIFKKKKFLTKCKIFFVTYSEIYFIKLFYQLL